MSLALSCQELPIFLEGRATARLHQSRALDRVQGTFGFRVAFFELDLAGLAVEIVDENRRPQWHPADQADPATLPTIDYRNFYNIMAIEPQLHPWIEKFQLAGDVNHPQDSFWLKSGK